MSNSINGLYPMNKYQTPINDELKSKLKKEIYEELIETIDSVKFIQNLIAPEEQRGFAKDRPKDPNYDDGRIIVDLTNPHIMEDLDFFRERALFYQKHGKYTNLPVDPNPLSEYGKFWKTEVQRWKNGYVRPSDGEWIPGQLYFYWNYAPIWLSKDVKTMKGSKKAKSERVRDFAKPWLADYLFYHYMDQSRSLGLHGKLLKCRGVGFLEPNTSILQQSTGTIKVGDVKVGDMLLDRYGNDTKVLEVYPQGKQDIYEVTFIDGRTVKCGKDHLWSVYDKNKGSKKKDEFYTYKTSDLIEKGLSWKNNNGDNLYKFYVPDLAEPVKYKEQDLFISPYILGALLGDGSMSTKSIKIVSDDIEVINKIQKDLGDDYILTKDSTNNNYRIVYKHLYENGHIRTNPLKKHIIDNKWNFTTDLKHIPNIYKYSSYEQRLELVKGLMDTDGSISKNGNLEFSNSNETLIDDLASVLRSMGISCTKGLGRKPRQKEIKGKLCNIKQEFRLYIRTNTNLFYIKRKSDRVRNKKIFLNNAIVSIKNLNYSEESTCFLVDNAEHLYLTNDFVPTHNSFKMGTISPCNMYTLPGSGNPNFHLANSKDFLTGDKGIWTKITDTLDWIGDNTPLPKMRMINSDRDMTITMGYKDPHGARRGLGSSVFAISLKDNPEKARGIRGPLIHYEEDGLFDNLEKAWNVNLKAVEDGDSSFGYMLAGGCLTARNKVWTKDGRLVNIDKLTKKDGIVGYDGENASRENINWFKKPSLKECVRITTSGGDFIECSVDHPILNTLPHWRNKSKGLTLGKYTKFNRADELKIGDQILTIDKLNIFGNKRFKHARLLGLSIGDGCYRKNQSLRVSCGDIEIKEYLESNYDCNLGKDYGKLNGDSFYNITVRNVLDVFREAGVHGDVNLDKKLPTNIHEYDKKSLSELIGGYYDADGNVNYNKTRNRVRVVLTSISKTLLAEVKQQLVRFGIHSKISKEKRKEGYGSNKHIYRLYITSKKDLERFRIEIPLLCKHKNENLKKIDLMSDIDRTRLSKEQKGYFVYNDSYSKGKYFIDSTMTNFRQESIKSIEHIGEQLVYNLNTSITNTYLGNNFITHNTGGTTGASFEGSEKLFYSPSAYNIMGVPNVYDRNADGSTECGFFWGAYMSRNKCYDLSVGEPDVIKALIELLEARYIVKYSSTDMMAITQKKAEDPITPQEAVMRTSGTVFPVSDLKEHLENISIYKEKFLSEHYIGDLVRTSSGEVRFVPDEDKIPLRSYDKIPNDRSGGIEIFEMPKKNNEGVIQTGRYIAGIDPIDADNGTSLFSILVMDLFTDRIVAEYTGRPRFAEEAYDISLRLLDFYNATANYEQNLKGLFSYYDKNHKLYRLCDTPQILKDMELTKNVGYGNLSKGTRANKETNKWGRALQAEWQKRFDDGGSNSSMYDEEGNARKLKLHSLRSIAYIEECIKWTPDGNFDRVSAGGMLMILREDRFKMTESAKTLESKGSSLANDNFFNKNYRK